MLSNINTKELKVECLWKTRDKLEA